MKFTIKVKRDQTESNGSNIPVNLDNVKTEEHDPNRSNSTIPDQKESLPEEPIYVISSDEEQEDNDENNSIGNQHTNNNQLVVYDPSVIGSTEIVAAPEHTGFQTPNFRKNPFPNYSSRVLPSVGAFTVQCANCFKWRLIPTKEKYEEIREHILEQPFVCETGREWRPDISCDDPPDISQDGSRLWAIDKPNIAQPPPGWQRLLRIRGEGSTKFADVYYVAPSGKRLRSMVEIQKYLEEHPEYIEGGVQMSQFSFQIPRPLQDNYVRKRPARMPNTNEGDRFGLPSEANPIAWAAPDENTQLQLGMPGISPFYNASISEPLNPPAKKKKKKTQSKKMTDDNLALN